MAYATCNWCQTFIEVEAGYNPQIHRRYCSVACIKADAAFEEYFSDENLGLRNYELYGINNHTGKRNG